ncbi:MULTISPECIES: hypothetical protein [unclassified Moorena]|nr:MULTISPECIES: hypothetical protein [unclassified Moorena]
MLDFGILKSYEGIGTLSIVLIIVMRYIRDSYPYSLWSLLITSA